MARQLVRTLPMLCAAALACDDAVAPIDVSGTYVLSRFNGADVPAVLLEYTDAGKVVSQTIVTDTLRVWQDGKVIWGTRVLIVSTTESGVTQSVPLESAPLELVFSMEGGAIHFRPRVPLDLRDCDCYIPDHWGTLTADGIDMEDRRFPERRIYSYRRVE